VNEPRALRVVSLVPSATETLLALGLKPIACTRFCEQPGIATVGGTKDPHVEEIVALAPDLVVVNDEENRVEDAARLGEAGLAVYSMSPRSVAAVGPAVAALAQRVGVSVSNPFGEPAWSVWQHASVHRGSRRRAATLVWRRPWMTMAAETYGASLFELVGLDNVVGDNGDTRYPELTLDALAALDPEVVVLPDEPYPFGERHVAEIEVAVPHAEIALVDGKDLFWWGIRTPGARARLGAQFG
jgi:ABC-type Fe3+-hydroxamate transport system substrate-binding protein